MAQPKAKKTGVTGASSRLRRAGPVPDIVYGDQKALGEGESAELFARLKREAGPSEKVPPVGFEAKDQEVLFGETVEALRQRGVEVPDDLSGLDAGKSEALVEAFDGLMAELFNDPGAVEGFRGFFISKVCGRRETTREEKAIMALMDVESAAARFRQVLAEGNLSCDDLPYAARQRLSEIVRTLDGVPGRESELEARLVAQQAEILRLRSAVPHEDAELAALEAEVAAMVEQGRAPELYSERPDNRETSFDFLRRAYGKYLEKGREAIYLHQIRKIDPKFANVLVVACHRAGKDVSELVPRKTDRTERILNSVGAERAADVSNALTALKMRKTRK